jgi:8-oxo-dGTP pyrophosphatase MutT (NUDIX family)
METQQNIAAIKEAVQAAAICWRLGTTGDVEVLLVSSLDTGRWIIPKGNRKPKERSHRAAQREAAEESGVVGDAKKKPVGFFFYLKDGQKPTTASVHLLRTRSIRKSFAERGSRRMVWVHPLAAAGMVAEPELSDIFLAIAEASSPVVQSAHGSFDAAKAFKKLLRDLNSKLHPARAAVVATP